MPYGWVRVFGAGVANAKTINKVGQQHRIQVSMKAKLNLPCALPRQEAATIHVIQMPSKGSGKAKKPPLKTRDIKSAKNADGGTTIIFTFPPHRRSFEGRGGESSGRVAGS
jgi:hypothetical protein